ncbi:heme-copper oxidase subunit III, partial [Flavobacteriaceae bacterium]|nr:heme-copper oxidase subunit III [Flavobacteriaceae bacterium]
MDNRNSRTKKMMLWFGMISMSMTFAGLTSAYVVSSSRADWLEGFVLPQAFSYSTLIILLSSLTFFVAKRSLQQNKIAQF